jgi:hypothetical protein
VSVVYCCMSASFDITVILINEANTRTRQILYLIVYRLFAQLLHSYVQDSEPDHIGNRPITASAWAGCGDFRCH